MTYVIADVHGDYEKYRRMLETIALSEQDTLYVLGDVVDRGPEPIKILQDMMARPNVMPILGNHEFMAAYCLKRLLVEITDESIANLDAGTFQGLQNWFENGGQTTLRQFHALPQEERRDVLDFLCDFSLYEEVTVGGRDYLLVHAGLENFSPDRPLEDYEPYEMLFSRPDYERPYFPDKIVVTGHTSTRSIPGNPRPGRIFKGNNHIAIDCGCGYGGLLGAICLDTGEEFYVVDGAEEA